MMNSVAPVWDGNETWLVLGGAGLLAPFPLVYAVFLPALYIGVFLMLAGLIFRGVAFEFRFKAEPGKRGLWNWAFFGGSLVATFAQGAVVGTFIQGFETENMRYVGGPLDWLTPFTVMTGLALVAGYALLGATWLLLKTEGEPSNGRGLGLPPAGHGDGVLRGHQHLDTAHRRLRARAAGSTTSPGCGSCRCSPCWWRPAVAFLKLLLRGHAVHGHHRLFGLFYAGLLFSKWPYVVPPNYTFHDAASAPESQLFLLIGRAVRDSVRAHVHRLDLLRVPRQGARRRRVSLIAGGLNPRVAPPRRPGGWPGGCVPTALAVRRLARRLGAGLATIALAGLVARLVHESCSPRWIAGCPAWLLAALAALLRHGLQAVRDWLRSATRPGGQADLRDGCSMRPAQAGPLRLAQGGHPGPVGQPLPGTGGALGGYYARYLPARLALLVPGLILLAVLWLDWLAAGLLLLAAPLIPVFTALIGMGSQQVHGRQQAEQARLAGHFLDRIRGLDLLRRSGALAAAQAEVAAAAERYRQLACACCGWPSCPRR
jgi:cytochrome bd ubiquinol oxidase subunit II